MAGMVLLTLLAPVLLVESTWRANKDFAGLAPLNVADLETSFVQLAGVPEGLELVVRNETELNMGCYFISLPDRLDYVNKFIEENGIANAVHVSAVEKGNISLLELRRDGKLHEDSRLNHGEVACALSHRKMMNLFLESDQEYAMVFEDDSAWNPKALGAWGLKADSKHTWIEVLAKTLVSAKHLNWDLLNLGRCLDVCTNEQVVYETATGGKIVKSMLPLCSNAYLMTRKGARLLLEAGHPVRYPEDWVRLLSRGRKIRTLSTTPRLFDQISHKNHNSLHRSKTLVECKDYNYNPVPGHELIVQGWDL